MLNKTKSYDDVIEIYLDFEPNVPLPQKYDFTDKERNISLEKIVDNLCSKEKPEKSYNEKKNLFSNYLSLIDSSTKTND